MTSQDWTDYVATEETIRGFAQLEEDWDSYGGKTIDQRCIEQATTFLGELRPEVRVQAVPTATGGVQLEWHGGGVDMEFSFEPAKTKGSDGRD
jgi:hypothetical protein